MRVFISYSSTDREVAEEIQLALLGEGHVVFFDKDSLPAGGNYHSRIDKAIRAADSLVFLISPSSIAPGSYALTELKFARTKWPHPKDRIVPVRLHATPWDAMPAYLKSVTVLEPSGNVAAEVLAAVMAFHRQPAEFSLSEARTHPDDKSEGLPANKALNHRAQVWIAVIGLVGVLGAALIANWEKIFHSQVAKPDAAEVSIPSRAKDVVRGIKGPDGVSTGTPVLNTQCPEVTFVDYSKVPPESTIVRRCDP